MSDDKHVHEWSEKMKTETELKKEMDDQSELKTEIGASGEMKEMFAIVSQTSLLFGFFNKISHVYFDTLGHFSHAREAQNIRGWKMKRFRNDGMFPERFSFQNENKSLTVYCYKGAMNAYDGTNGICIRMKQQSKIKWQILFRLTKIWDYEIIMWIVEQVLKSSSNIDSYLLDGLIEI